MHLANSRGGPTLLGAASAYTINRLGAPADFTYLKLLQQSGRLRYVLALEALALDIGTRGELDNMVETYRDTLEKLGLPTPVEEVYYAFGGMKSDLPHTWIVGLGKPLDTILEILEA